MIEEKKFPVTVSFMGKKYRTMVLAQNQHEADLKALSLARAKVQIVNDSEILDMVANVMSGVYSAFESNHLMKEGEVAMEELSKLQLMGKPTAEKMKEAFGKILAWANKAYESADIMIEVEKRHSQH